MRASLATLWAIIGLSLIGCQNTTSPTPAAGETPILISKEIWGHFQKYLNSGSPLAFAVSRDGNFAASYSCEEGNCQQYNMVRVEALNACAKLSRQQCIIFAKWSTIVVPYEIAPY